jgi:glycosyltransferase involved in cell wall biosynthesis
MPVYNGERFLAEAVESILGQTYADFELVAVDDASTDGSRSVLDRYRDPRVRVLTNERNLGGAASANRAMTEARGVYIARMDQDDVSLPARLEKQVDFLDRHPGIALVGTWAEIIDEEGREIGQRRFATASDDLYRLLLKFCALVHSSVMFRRAPVLAVGGYGSGALGRFCRDYELWLRLSETVRLANLPEILVGYRVHSGQMSAERVLGLIRDTAACRKHAIRRRRSAGLGGGAPLTRLARLRGELGSIGYDYWQYADLRARQEDSRLGVQLKLRAMFYSPLAPRTRRALASAVPRAFRWCAERLGVRPRCDIGVFAQSCSRPCDAPRIAADDEA